MEPLQPVMRVRRGIALLLRTKPLQLALPATRVLQKAPLPVTKSRQ